MSEALRRKHQERILADPDPERIWLGPRCEWLGDGRTWAPQPQEHDDPGDECKFRPIEYIRLDLAIAGGYMEIPRK